jgi:hypothetical protein
VGQISGSSAQGIFLSYRREDSAPHASSLQLQLSQRLPGAQVFMDLDSIEPGLDFAEIIEQAVGSCAVLVALIGRQWATLTDEQGDRRLDNPDDFVRFEVQAALQRKVRVIPVLVDGAKPLRRQDLPAELHKLSQLNAHTLSYARYKYDTDQLVELIQRVLAAVSEREEAETQAREQAETQAREQAETQAREQAETQAREDTETQAREQAEIQARLEQARRAREEQARKLQEEQARKAREEQARKEQARKAREEWARKVREDPGFQAREDAERQAREDAELQAWEQARKAREEQARKAREDP